MVEFEPHITICHVYHQADKLLLDVRSAKKVLRDELKSLKRVRV